MSTSSESRSLRRALDGLALFLDVFDDPIGRAARAVLTEPSHTSAAQLVAQLLGEAELYPEEMVGDHWQNHLLDRLLTSDNPFSRKAERVGPERMGDGLLRQAGHELGLLQSLFRDGGAVLAAQAYTSLSYSGWAGWGGSQVLGAGPSIHTPQARAFKKRLAEASEWLTLLSDLAGVYAASGVGIFGRYRAFRWVRTGEHGALEGVERPDPTRLTDLVGYEREREPVISNARRFAAGYPGNNVLIYGERGTGKSSTVKALLNELGDQGLRLIEISKEHLEDFPSVMAALRDRRERFIIYVDDLSFEEQETHYKALKAVLEGGIEARPDNIVLYATSNRRHLVRERFADRDGALDDDVFALDTLEEKLSLADRFGIRVTFSAADQNRFLLIVRALAATRAIALPPEELDRRALSWAQRQRGRSGRSARQFIDNLVGELALP